MSGQNVTPTIPVENCGGQMSSEECEWLQRPDHPLLNNVILDLVFEHVTRRRMELKECRLVCKTWNVSMIPYTRKTFVVKIHGNNIKNTRIHRIQKFVDDFRSNTLGIPFGRFKLGSFCTTDGVGQEFLKLCGDTITDIEFLEEAFVVEDVSELLKSTPKLETCKIPMSLQSHSGKVVKLFPDGLENSKSKLTALKVIRVPSGSPEERNKYCPTFMKEFMTAASNINCLDLYCSSSNSSFEVLCWIEKLGRESSIEELKISVEQDFEDESDYEEYVDLLLTMALNPNGLRLKRFDYSSDIFDQRSLAFQLIPHFKDSLEFLDLSFHNTRCTGLMEFPKMSRLTKMDLSSFQRNFKFRCVNLNETFPVLRELILRHSSYEQADDEFFPDSPPCPNMNALILTNRLTINGFNQMLTVFPHLTNLNIDIKEDGAEILRRMWSQMTQLKHLSIHGYVETKDSLDSVFTGIPTHALQEVRDAIKDLEKIPVELGRREMILKLRNQFSTLPSIGNLTSLVGLLFRLTGYGVNECEGKFITDLTGYFGFYSMTRLNRLWVHNCELTKTCCEILKEDMGLLQRESWLFWNSEDKNII